MRNTRPRIILTSDDQWDPIILDCTIDGNNADNDDWYDRISDTSTKYNDTLFDSTGGYKYRNFVHVIDISNYNIVKRILPNNSLLYDFHETYSYNTCKNNHT